MKTLPKVIGLLVVVAALGAGGYQYFLTVEKGDSSLLRVSGNIEVTTAEVSFRVAGRVEQRLFDEGQVIRQGQVAAILDSTDLQQDVDLQRAELQAVQSKLDELVAGSRPEEIAAAKAAAEQAQGLLDELEHGSRPQEIAVAQATYDRAVVEKNRIEADFTRTTQLYEQRVVSVEDYQRDRAAYSAAQHLLREAAERLELAKIGPRQEQIDQARSAHQHAQSQYELVKEGPRKETIEQARAQVGQAQASLELAQTRLSYATITSPLTGIVLSKNIEPGEYVAPGTPVITVGDIGHPWLRAYVNETDLGRVKQGQAAEVTADTYPGRIYAGRVSFISSEAEFTPKNVQTEQERVKLVYRIKIDVDNPKMELKPGMPADAKIQLAPMK
jgi:HlyD family secretion protein